MKNAFDKENYNLYDEIVVNRSVHFESKSIKCKQNIFLENPIELLLLLYNGQKNHVNIKQRHLYSIKQNEIF